MKIMLYHAHFTHPAHTYVKNIYCELKRQSRLRAIKHVFKNKIRWCVTYVRRVILDKL